MAAFEAEGKLYKKNGYSAGNRYFQKERVRSRDG